MKTRRIGSLEVSVVGLGANNFTDFFGKSIDQAGATKIVDAALDAGVTFIDTAEEYSVKMPFGSGHSEQYLGVALGARRDDVVIASKWSIKNQEHPDERGAKRIVRAIEGSLQRLGTDRIDLYQQHFPDPEIPVDEVVEALDRLVRDGKVREIGSCNFSGEMLDESLAASAARGFAPLVTTQNQYNVLDLPTQAGVLDACARHGLKLLPYFPLASGLLTGKYRKGETVPAGTRLAADTFVGERMRKQQLSDQRLDTVAELDAFARDRGHTLIELAISWLVAQPVVASVIAGASTPEQITANAAAACWDLTADELRGIDAIVASGNAR